MDLSEFDEFGQWTGTCTECGTDHDGNHPVTFAGKVACLRSQARDLGAVHVEAELDQLEAKLVDVRDQALFEFLSGA